VSRNSYTKKDIAELNAIRVRFTDLVRKLMTDPKHDTMFGVAKFMGWPQGTLSAIFSGAQSPTLMQIKKLAEVCGVTTDEIINGIPPSNKQLKKVRSELEKILEGLPK